MLRYSTVIVARDCPKQLLTTLMALRVRAQPDEVILVDNASVVQLEPIATLSHLPVRIVRLEQHQSLGAALNAGIEAATHDAILLLHGDSQLSSDPLAAVAHLREQPRLGIIGGKLFRAGPEPRLLLQAGYQVGRARINPRPVGELARDIYHEPMEIAAASTACMLIRRTALRFDERYWFRFEDVDFCHQYAQQGWKIMMLPALQAIHLEDGGLRERSTDPVWAARQLASHLLYHARWCADTPIEQHPPQAPVRREQAGAYLQTIHESMIGYPCATVAGETGEDWAE